jgi:beta-lactamase regulating signal transducer with metallopeptidase domain
LIQLLLAYALKGIIVLGVAQGAVALFGKASPSSRHAVYAVSAAGLLLMLPLARALPPLHLSLVAGGRAGLVLNLLILGWLFPAIFLVAKILREQAELERVRRLARPIDDDAILAAARRALTRFDIGRPVAIASWAAAVPVTFGVWRPVILLPEEASGWSTERLDSTLLHEMAHIARFDAATQTISRLVAAFHWFNPLAWHSLKSIRTLAEQSCDELVLAAGADPRAYARTLVETAREAAIAKRQSPAVLAAAAPEELEERMRLILESSGKRRRPPQARILVLVAAAAVLCFWLAPMRAEAPTYYRAAPAAPAALMLSAFTT